MYIYITVISLYKYVCFCVVQMQYVQPALAHNDQFYRRAAYIAVAVTSEGCADHLSSK